MTADQSAIRQLNESLFIDLPIGIFAPVEFGSFNEPVDPPSLLDGSGPVWGGQMLPDALPVSGNGCGDQLMARFNAGGQIAEIVEWNHEGAYWHPSEAIPRYPSPVGQARTLCAKALGAFRTPPRLGAPGQPKGPPFDWEAVESAAMRASARQDLAWPGAVLGWIHECKEQSLEALRWYAHGLRAFETTLDFVTGWSRGAIPSSVDFLRESISDLGSLPNAEDRQVAAKLGGLASIRAYWLDLGIKQLGAGKGDLAYESFYRAGWDAFFYDDIAIVLEHLVLAADAAGSRPLKALAAFHLRNFT